MIYKSLPRLKRSSLGEQRPGRAHMRQDLDAFAFPELPDEAVVAINDFLEDFYNAFQNHHFVQLLRRSYDQRPDDDQPPVTHDPSF